MTESLTFLILLDETIVLLVDFDLSSQRRSREVDLEQLARLFLKLIHLYLC